MKTVITSEGDVIVVDKIVSITRVKSLGINRFFIVIETNTNVYRHIGDNLEEMEQKHDELLDYISGSDTPLNLTDPGL